MGVIFRDREKLTPRYIPSYLPHREDEIRLLWGFFRDALSAPSETHLKTVQIIGGVGSGKTAVTRLFGDRFEAEAKKARVSLKHIYVNLKLHGRSRVILYRYLVQQAAPEVYSTSLSAEELLYELVRYLKGRSRYILVTMDEIDYFIKHAREPDVIYDLTRLEEVVEPGTPCNVFGVIFTARSKEFYKDLDQAALSTLGRLPIEFKPYTASQILDILEMRVEEAFKPGAISNEVVEYVADLTASKPINGDLRYALDLLLYSGNLAENEGCEKVTAEHVRRVLNITHPSLTDEDVVSLPDREKIVLLGVARALKLSGGPYTSLKDVRAATAMVCEEHKLKPLSVEDVDDAVEDLRVRGIVDIKSLSAIGLSGVPADALSRFLDALVQRLESGLDEG